MTAISGNDSSIVGRMVRASRLDDSLYEEVERDRDANSQAALIVIVTSIFAGIATAFSTGEPIQLVVGVIAGVLGWLAYAFICYFIGTRLLAGAQTSSSWGELARTLGFASSPRMLLILGVIPILGALVGLVVGVWVIITTVIALRAALDVSTGRAVVVGLVAVIVYAIVSVIPVAIIAAIL